MNNLEFHKCKICGSIFYSSGKTTYCAKCVPKFKGAETDGERFKAYSKALKSMEFLEMKRARDRARWHARMANPEFRESERLRSLARAKANRKYLVKEVKNES